MTREELICFKYGQAAKRADLPANLCCDTKMAEMISPCRTPQDCMQNLRNMTAWYVGHLKQFIEEGNLLDDVQFKNYASNLLPDASDDAANLWVRHAKQQLEQENYVSYFRDIDPLTAASQWFESYLAGLINARMELGLDSATRMYNFGMIDFCLGFPGYQEAIIRSLEYTDAKFAKQMMESPQDFDFKIETYPQLEDAWGRYDSAPVLTM